MRLSHILFQDLSFGYPGAPTRLIEDLSVHFNPGWTGIVGANGAGKTTVLKLAMGELAPDQGVVRTSEDAIYCPQRTDDAPDMLPDLLEACDHEAAVLIGRLGIQLDWPNRWQTLSHGERKRAQLAVALWRRPAILAVDEPTNHIDAHARELLGGALQSFEGVGLLVSHDRQLLDSLCSQCLFVEPPDAVMRHGGFSVGAGEIAREDTHARRKREGAHRARKALKREAVKRREEASQSHKKRSKSGLAMRGWCRRQAASAVGRSNPPGR
jgi:ATPase subunit of ABC transporter with duplicated ATPase domains